MTHFIGAVFVLLIVALRYGFLPHWIGKAAERSGRVYGTWFLLGLFFSLWAWVVLGCMSPKVAKNEVTLCSP